MESLKASHLSAWSALPARAVGRKTPFHPRRLADRKAGVAVKRTEPGPLASPPGWVVRTGRCFGLDAVWSSQSPLWSSRRHSTTSLEPIS